MATLVGHGLPRSLANERRNMPFMESTSSKAECRRIDIKDVTTTNNTAHCSSSENRVLREISELGCAKNCPC